MSKSVTQQLLSQLDIDFPLLLAPMAGGISTPELVASVSNQGCLGSLGGGYLSAAQLEQQIQQTKKLTIKAFGVNLFIPGAPIVNPQAIMLMQHKLNRFRRELGIPEQESFVFPASHFQQQMDVILAADLPVFSFAFGILEPRYMQALKARQTFVIGTATNLEEAKALAASGCDAIVAQGVEAGGHRGTFIGDPAQSLMGLMTLTQQLLANITLPVIAAGGIRDGAGLKAALTLGAAAVQMGSAFLICPESGAAEAYKTILIESEGEDTVLTNTFSGKLARGINNTFIKTMQADNGILSYPQQHYLTMDIRKAAAQQDKPEYLSLWAGQGVGLLRDRSRSVKTIIDDIKHAVTSI